MLGTLEEYLQTGSVSETSRRQYCHRNTVLNRLARVRELTGCDPTVPRDAALLCAGLDLLARETGGTEIQETQEGP